MWTIFPYPLCERKPAAGRFGFNVGQDCVDLQFGFTQHNHGFFGIRSFDDSVAALPQVSCDRHTD